MREAARRAGAGHSTMHTWISRYRAVGASAYSSVSSISPSPTPPARRCEKLTPPASPPSGEATGTASSASTGWWRSTMAASTGRMCRGVPQRSCPRRPPIHQSFFLYNCSPNSTARLKPAASSDPAPSTCTQPAAVPPDRPSLSAGRSPPSAEAGMSAPSGSHCQWISSIPQTASSPAANQGQRCFHRAGGQGFCFHRHSLLSIGFQNAVQPYFTVSPIPGSSFKSRVHISPRTLRRITHNITPIFPFGSNSSILLCYMIYIWHSQSLNKSMSIKMYLDRQKVPFRWAYSQCSNRS